MEKLTKSLSLFKERNCSVSIRVDSRTRRKNACEFPHYLFGFTIDRKFFGFTVGKFYWEKALDICNGRNVKARNHKLWGKRKDTIAHKYKEIR